MVQERRREWQIRETPLSTLSGTLGTDFVEIKQMRLSNMSGTRMYFQLFDTGSVPVLNDVPRRSYGVSANSNLVITYLESREYQTGSVFAWSSTYGSLTTGSYTNLSVEITYREY